MATEGEGRSKMGRNNSSYIIYIILAVILVTLLYFSWSLNTQVKGARAEKRSLESELTRNEGETNKLKSQLQALNEEIQSLTRQKTNLETEKEKLLTELNEAKASIVSGCGREHYKILSLYLKVSDSNKLTESKSSIENLQQKLEDKSGKDLWVFKMIFSKKLILVIWRSLKYKI